MAVVWKSRAQPGLTEHCTRHGSLWAVLVLILFLQKEIRSNCPRSCGFALLLSLAGGEGSGMLEPGFYNPWKINLLSPLCSSEMGKK